MPVSLPQPLLPLDESQFVRLTADEYQAMTESGVLREAPMELLDGMLVWKDRRDRGGSMMNVGVRHGNCVARLQRHLDRACDGHASHAQSQQPVKLNVRNVPEPDVMVLRGELEDYDTRHPEPADVLLVIEVADSSLSHDRGGKLRKYAAAGIAEYWIVNLLQDQFEVYQSPDTNTGTYGRRTDFARGASVSLTLPDGTVLTVDVSRMLP